MFELRIDLVTALRHFALIFGSTVLSFLVVLLATPHFHRLLIKWQIFKKQRLTNISGQTAEVFRSLHMKKEGTPTMGGILIWGTALLLVLLSPLLQYFDITRFSLLTREETYLPLFTLVVCGILGLVDDFINVRTENGHQGIRARVKFLWLILFSLAGGLWFHYKLGIDLISIPGIGEIPLGAWYIVLFMFIIIASANAVNITDGLDGLAGGLLVIAFASYGLIAYLHGLLILAAFCAVIAGGTIAFVWFNIAPALFFMGDTGALALGATLGVIAMLTDSVFILPFVAFVFVVEALSVIIQLISKKFRHGKKVFLIAPLHHHFEAKGWPEGKVVMRFWILGGFVASLGVILEILSLLGR